MCGNGWYLVVLGQYLLHLGHHGKILVGTLRFWVILEHFWLVLGRYGAIVVGTCW